MAIKSSNQITFTEHKKIIEIREYYLATSENSGITIESTGWTTDMQTMDYKNKYLWNYEEVIYSIGSSDVSDPVIIGVYGESGSSLQIKYISSSTTPIIYNNDVSEWVDIVPSPNVGEKIYMTQKLSTDINWSIPIQISAIDGEMPTITIIDGYWCVNGESTGVKAEGENGGTPEITIGNNGNWYINGVDSGTKAQGEAGKDGASIEYVYYRSKEEISLPVPSYTDDKLTEGWTASPQGITIDYKYEYVSVRNKPSGENWGQFSTPVIWSKWGEKGQDGDGVEYKYYLSNSSEAPTYSVGDTNWTDDPQGVSVYYQYEYVVQIKISNGSTIQSEPSLWAKFGENGVGIIEIKNYYVVTTDVSLPESPNWDEKVPLLSPTNKYLWNYEIISYTDGSSTSTAPAIIGVYGDSGTDVITFEIYSTKGFMFKENLKSIELNVAAFKGNEPIDDATYTWEWWNDSLNEGVGGYSVIIENSSDMPLVINEVDEYAFANLRCIMNYDGKKYEDYIVLTSETVIYNAVVKFCDGSNIFDSSTEYLLAFTELYQNNNRVETIAVNAFCSGVSSLSPSGIIETSITGDFADGDKMYFVCQETNGLYTVVLGKYASGAWESINNDTIYTYANSLYPDAQTNIIAISKESINKSVNVDFVVYKDGIEIARTNVNVIDSNDPIIGNNEPLNPVYGQLWLDTSVSPSKLKIFKRIDGENYGEWILCSGQEGQAVYTYKPSKYNQGDLWILSENWNGYGAGTMLKATTSSTSFDDYHWIDADAEMTKLKNDIQQNMTFDPQSGLYIGQTDNAFYVNISSSKMSFYDNSQGKKQEVVYISNNSAVIKNLIAENSATFNCSANFNGEINIGSSFVLKIESNGSLSLAVPT